MGAVLSMDAVFSTDAVFITGSLFVIGSVAGSLYTISVEGGHGGSVEVFCYSGVGPAQSGDQGEGRETIFHRVSLVGKKLEGCFEVLEHVVEGF